MAREEGIRYLAGDGLDCKEVSKYSHVLLKRCGPFQLYLLASC